MKAHQILFTLEDRCRECGHIARAHKNATNAIVASPCLVQICACPKFYPGDGTERPR